MKKKKIVSGLLFLIGLGIILYPFVSRTFYDLYSRKEANQIAEAFANGDLSDELYNKQLAYNSSKTDEKEEIGVAEVSFVKDKERLDSESVDYLSNKNVLGILRIPRINLVYPIYDGASYENLLDGVARIEGTSYPVGGLNTNSVIAGHNGLVGRTYFSHIKKLVSGDTIEIQNRKEILTYKVYSTKIIKPENVAALAIIPGQDTVTLLTCTWPPPGTHRYLIFARRASN